MKIASLARGDVVRTSDRHKLMSKPLWVERVMVTRDLGRQIVSSRSATYLVSAVGGDDAGRTASRGLRRPAPLGVVAQSLNRLDCHRADSVDFHLRRIREFRDRPRPRVDEGPASGCAPGRGGCCGRSDVPETPQ